MKVFAFSSAVSVCDPLNISMVGGKSFCSTVTGAIISQEQGLVAMEFTDQVSTFVELNLLWN